MLLTVLYYFMSINFKIINKSKTVIFATVLTVQVIVIKQNVVTLFHAIHNV